MRQIVLWDEDAVNFYGCDPSRKGRCDDRECVFLLLNLNEDLYIENLILFLVQNLNLPRAVHNLRAGSGFIGYLKFHVTFSDNNITFYCF